MTRLALSIVVLSLSAIALAGMPRPQPARVDIRVDTGAAIGPMYPFWAWFGHDEPY